MSVKETSSSRDNSIVTPSSVEQPTKFDRDLREKIREHFKELAEMYRSVSFCVDCRQKTKVVTPFVKEPNDEGFKKASELGIVGHSFVLGVTDISALIGNWHRMAATIEKWMEQYYPAYPPENIEPLSLSS